MNPGLGLAAPVVSSVASRLCAAIGVLSLVAGAIVSPASVWPYLLLLSYAMVGLGLGATAFIALQYIVGSGWSAAFRRVPEAMIAALPIGFVGLWIVFLAHPSVYSWQGAAHEAVQGIAWFKHAWLSWPFFLARAAVYMALWGAFAYAILRHSRRQDATGDVSHTKSNIHLSAGFLAVFGITSFLASVDWIMSLEPNWYSTMFGWYNFAGMFESALAVIILMTVWLERRGQFRGVVNEAHLYDLGKLLFAFSTFWMYLWFSQYMLIWYSNQPEETKYFIERIGTATKAGPYKAIFFLNLIINFLCPLLILMKKGTKRNWTMVTFMAVLIIFGHWLDFFQMVMPGTVHGHYHLMPFEFGIACLFIGLIMWGTGNYLSKHSLLAKNHPFLKESMIHHT